MTHSLENTDLEQNQHPVKESNELKGIKLILFLEIPSFRRQVS